MRITEKEFIKEGLKYVEDCILNVLRDPDEVSDSLSDDIKSTLKDLYAENFYVDWAEEGLDDDDEGKREYFFNWEMRLRGEKNITRFCQAYAVSEYRREEFY
ncbi:hypothetical protein [Vibrio parahaemolyticus]|uniref:hypothetical protein n=1 Tax=Vibrio parahaemolyticus TaxID=670 RepID=UPI00301BF9ED